MCLNILFRWSTFSTTFLTLRTALPAPPLGAILPKTCHTQTVRRFGHWLQSPKIVQTCKKEPELKYSGPSSSNHNRGQKCSWKHLSWSRSAAVIILKSLDTTTSKKITMFTFVSWLIGNLATKCHAFVYLHFETPRQESCWEGRPSEQDVQTHSGT